MNEKWRVSDNGNSIEEDFATEQEALDFAAESLALYREEAVSEGEWADEVEFLAIYKMVHCTKVISTGDEGEAGTWVEYGIRPVED